MGGIQGPIRTLADTKKYMLWGNNVPILISAPAFTYLISAVVMCQLSNSGSVERPFLKKILERLDQTIDAIDIPNKPG